MKKVLFSYIFISFFFIKIISAHNILLLNSYHRFFNWTDSINRTIIKNFNNDTFYTEFLDSKRFDREKMFKIFYPYIAEKYKNVKIDLIVVTDNNALDFIIKYHKKLFDKVPVVFCGINNFNKSILKGDEYVTGVVENVYLEDTVKIILKLHPQIKTIHAIMGASFTSQIYFKKFCQLKEKFKNKVIINILNGFKLDKSEMIKKLENLKDGVIFFLNLFKLKDGSVFSIKTSYDFINKYTNLPIYTCWDVMLQFKNVVGGKITSSYLQGVYASAFIYQILKTGVPVYSLPVLTKAPAQYIFNYNTLKKFDIDLNRLPSGSKILGKPSKEQIIIQKQQGYLLILTFLLLILLIILFFLIVNYLKRKKVEQQLSELIKEYEILINYSTDMVCVKDSEGRWILTNDTNTKLFSLENVDFKGKKDSELAELTPFFKDALLHCEKSDEKAWENGNFFRTEEIIPLPNGNKKIFDIIKIPIFNEKGDRKRLIVIGRDITDLKEYHEKMIHMQKMDLIGNLATGIAHDFNNILTSLSMNIELLHMFYKGDNAKIEKYFNNCFNSIESARNLINKIRKTSRKEERNLSKNNLIEIINNSIDMVEPSLKDNIKIIKNFNEGIPVFIICDMHEISQVIMNILVNAIDAIDSKDGEGVIKIDVSTDDKNVKLTISDNGIGIDKSIINQIFDPFFTTKKDFSKRGTGLGLAICKNIIDSYNGKLYVISEKGKGSEFVIELPYLKKDTEEQEIIKSVEKTNLNEKLKGKKILLIEDEINISEVEKELLENMGFKVYTAANGKEGIELFLEKKDIDIIFVDWQMPVMDGEKTVLELQKLGVKQPVFLVTGALDNTIQDFKDKGLVTNIISKPFYAEKIIEKLNSIY